MRRFILPLLALAVVVGPPLAYARFRAFHYRNFRVVAADRLYRSGQLSPYGLARVWHEFGIGTVVTLRQDDELKGTAGSDWEERWCKEHEVAFVRLPPQRWHVKGHGPVPAQANVDRFLEVLTNPDRYPRPVLLHCFKGTHRTGVFVALYRMEIEGWTNEEAIAELMTLGYDNLEDEPDVYDYLRSYRPKCKAKKVEGFNVNNPTLTPITMKEAPATPRAGGVSPLSDVAGKPEPEPMRQASFEVNVEPTPLLSAGVQYREIQLPLERELPTICQHGSMHLKRWIVVINSPAAFRGSMRGLNYARNRDTIELLDTMRIRPPEPEPFSIYTSFSMSDASEVQPGEDKISTIYFVTGVNPATSIEPPVSADQLLAKLCNHTHATWSPNQPPREPKPFQEPPVTIRVHPPTWVLGPDLNSTDDLITFLAEIEDLITLRFFQGDVYLCSFTLTQPIDLENWSLGTLILAFPFVGMDSGSPTADPRELLADRWMAEPGTNAGLRIRQFHPSRKASTSTHTPPGPVETPRFYFGGAFTR